MTIYYTLIGSREAPQNVCNLMAKFAKKCCSLGYIGRSGGADGCDISLEIGVRDYIAEEKLPLMATGIYMEVYLPWKDFNKRNSETEGYYTLERLHNKQTAEVIASETHPAWDRCKQGAQKLHTRNVYQLLGQDLETPSRFVLCWAKPKYNDRRTEEVQGGTATAVKLGIKNGVEIINLYHEDQFNRVKDWINK
jgi:hypothetical protein